MKVILLVDVKNVGRKDEIKMVADGYAQNVLLPKKLVLPATPEHIKQLEKKSTKIADKKALDEMLLINTLKDIAGKELVLSPRVNETGTLFQTLHTKDIIHAVTETFGVTIPESAISVADIKNTGTYPATLSSGSFSATLTVVVG